MREHLETFLAERREDGEGMPAFVVKELRSFLKCGVLAYGAVRFRCEHCGEDRLAGLSAQARSNGGEHDRLWGARGGPSHSLEISLQALLPGTKFGATVLSLPFPMRAPLAYHHELTLAVHAVAMRAIEGWYRAQGRALGIDDGHTGSITPLLENLVQRFGSDLALNVHLHILSLDGVYDSTSHFTPITAPSLEQMEKLCTTIAARVQRLLLRRAIDHDEPEERALALSLSRSAARLGTTKYAPEGADIEHDHDASWKRKARVDGFDLGDWCFASRSTSPL